VYFRNDLVIGESNRLKTIEDNNKFSISFSKIVAYDVGVYKVVARSKNGQVTARFRINEVEFLEEKRNNEIPELDYGVETDPIPLTSYEAIGTSEEIYRGKYSVILNARPNVLRYSKGYEKETELVSTLKHINLSNVIKMFKKEEVSCFLQEGGGDSLLNVLSSAVVYSEQTLCIITGQVGESHNLTTKAKSLKLDLFLRFSTHSPTFIGGATVYSILSPEIFY
jgi:hypothetical protein